MNELDLTAGESKKGEEFKNVLVILDNGTLSSIF